MAVSTISTKHPLYEEYKESWAIMRDCVDGEDVVKEKGVVYLPMKSAVAAITDLTRQWNVYKGYMMRAEFPEIVAPTIRGTSGLICQQAPTFELPTQMEYLLEDCTGDGTTLESLHKRIVTEQLVTGRYGILPGVDDEKPGQFILTGYSAEKIINWDKDKRGRVNFVVIDESDKERDPISNQWSDKERYLECTLDEAGSYIATRYQGNTPEDPIPALTAKREPIKFVPFVFIDTSDLTPEPDDVPMYGLAKIALRVYRLDADYMQGLHMTSEPTPYITGFDDAKTAIEEGNVPSTIGAANLWILPKGATADFLEFTGPGLASQAEAISSSLERAVLFGTQIFSENSKSAESGESRKMRLRGQHSLSRNIAITAAAGLERALRNIAVWAGLDPTKVVVRPYLDFIDFTLSAQELKELIAGWQSGAYSKKTLFENLQRADMIPKERDFEDEEELIEQEGPPLGTIRDNPADGGGL